MDIPANLTEQVRQGSVVLLLGAGASFGAKDSKGNTPPSGAGLAKLISDKYLGGEFGNSELSTVSEYAMSEHGLLAVQKFIAEIFQTFEPTEAHKLMPKFNWGGLATTNYDLLVEKAYASHAKPLQTPVAFIENGDQVIELLRDQRSVKFLKLHGCVSRIANDKCPLILTKDQYISYRKGRDRLFKQLTEWAYEHTIVFVGHSVQDADIREVIFELDTEISSRPRYFLIAPNKSEIERRFWETKKVTVLNGTFSDFLLALDAAVASEFRELKIAKTEPHDIARHFRVAGAVLSKNCLEFLTSDALYVKSFNPTARINPIDFYRGFDGEWASIEQNLDVPRAFVDDILEDIFLLDDVQRKTPLEVVLIKGYAGSGKTLALRRLAWQAAKDYDCLCIYLNDAARPNIGAIQEIIETCKERVFLFIDNAPERGLDIRKLINEIGESGKLLTIILAARHNEWNVVSGDIQSAVTEGYDVPALRTEEITGLLDLLEKHKALGRLTEKTKEERIEAFASLAGRQLLVALHEATLGRPFEEILEDEFNHLVPIEAQRVYLTVCILNRLDVNVRAGIISRIHGIPFTQFKERLYKPLEHVIYDAFDPRVRDNVYRARHPIIAEIVFERLLRDETERFTEYYRCLKALNLDYSTDEKAFRYLMRGRTILKLFSNVEHCNILFDEALKLVGEEPHLLQQRALYEMHRPNGDLNFASKLITQSIELQPYNKSFKHTKSELALRKSESARTDLERDKFLREAASLATETMDGRAGETHSHHTLAKVNIKRIEAELKNGNTDFTAPALQNLVRSAETVIINGLQAKPGDAYLLQEQANLAKLMSDVPKAVAALEKAVSQNTKFSFLAVQLADCYLGNNEVSKAKAVFEKALDANRNDRVLNYRYALFLEGNGGSLTDIAYFLKRSFSPGDRNFDAQIRHARALFLKGDYDEARSEFSLLRNNKNAPYVYGQRLYDAEGTYTGVVNGVRHSHIFVTETKSRQTIFIPRENVTPEYWRQFTEGTKVKLRISFNLRGPIGFDCEPASKI
ncbi:MAG: SIR2 family protein [Limisphaerales bacterium]